MVFTFGWYMVGFWIVLHVCLLIFVSLTSSGLVMGFLGPFSSWNPSFFCGLSDIFPNYGSPLMILKGMILSTFVCKFACVSLRKITVSLQRLWLLPKFFFSFYFSLWWGPSDPWFLNPLELDCTCNRQLQVVQGFPVGTEPEMKNPTSTHSTAHRYH